MQKRSNRYWICGALVASLAFVGCSSSKFSDSDSGTTPESDSIAGGDGSGGDGPVGVDSAVIPDAPEPGTPTTVFAINDETVSPETRVSLSGVIVTAVNVYGDYTGDVFVQDPKGGPRSGLRLMLPQRTDGAPTSDLKPGDRVDAVGQVLHWAPAGGYKHAKYPDKKYIRVLGHAAVTLVEPGGVVPAPEELTVEQATEYPGAQDWEAVLVRIKGARVTKEADPTYGEFRVEGELPVDDELHPHQPAVGDCINLTGVLLFFHLYKLAPRSAADIAASANCGASLDIAALQDEAHPDHPAPGSTVSVTGVVTAVDSNKSSGGDYVGFWLQTPGGGPLSGVYIFYKWTDATAPENKPVVGRTYELTGTYDEYPSTGPGVTEIKNASWVDKGPASVPLPHLIPAQNIATTNFVGAEPYEGFLVRVNNVQVTALKADSQGKNVAFADATTGLVVDYSLYDFLNPTPPSLGTLYASVVGVVQFAFGNFRLLPRGPADLILAP